MNIAVGRPLATTARVLQGKVLLVTGSTSAAVSITGIALPVDGGWTAH